MHNKVTPCVILLLLAQSLPAMWQGPLLLFRRLPEEKSGPATKALEEAFSRLPTLPPPGTVLAAAATDKAPPANSSPSDAVPSLLPPEVNPLQTASDLSKLFENKPDVTVPNVAPGTVSLPTNSPEVSITPGNQ